MANYDYKYRLQSAPEATQDGSGMVNHDVYALAQEQGNGGWIIVPGRHKTVQVPAATLTTVLDMPSGGAKISAYKDALADNLNTQGQAIVGWNQAQLEALMDANDLAAFEAFRANDYILSLVSDYPVDFSM